MIPVRWENGVMKTCYPAFFSTNNFTTSAALAEKMIYYSVTF